jgi:hypothetical protein
MYLNGNFVPQDRVKAAQWYRLAAEQGNAQAQGTLGYMYAAGLGVAQDYVLAHMWFDLSAQQGNADAARDRDKAASLMNPAGIAEAQRLAREWVAAHPR